MSFWKRLFGTDLGEPVIVVSGLPRSGTSMMMRMLEAGGLKIVTDRERAADEDNPKGYFELERVKDLDKDGADKSWVRDHRGSVLKVISFLLKDLPDDSRYKVVFMRRHLDEVLASQNKMLERRGESGGSTDDERMKTLYTTHLRKTDLLFEERGNLDRLDVDYRDALEDPASQARRVAAFVGGSLDVDAMAAAVESRLYRNRSDRPAS